MCWRFSGALGRMRVLLTSTVSWCAGVLFAGLFVINLSQVVMRQITGGWVWVADLNTVLFSWMVMLGAAAAYGHYEHITVSFLVERLPYLLGRVIAYLVRFIEMVLGLVLIISGFSVTETRMGIPYIQLGVPTGWTYLAIPILGVFILLFALLTKPHIPTTLEQVDPVDPTNKGEIDAALPTR